MSDKAKAKKAAKKAKQERKEHREKVLAAKPKAYWAKRAEKACNAYIRARDANLPCISCGATESFPTWQAGHYISVGANSSLRFDEDNINRQCCHCNLHKSSNAIEYRKGLIARKGEATVQRLEGWHPPMKRTIESYKLIEEMFKQKLKDLDRFD